MRQSVLEFACVLVLGGCSASLGQEPSGPRTLDNLLNADEVTKPTAIANAAVAESTETGPKRPAGTITRPTDGVYHPDLEIAWSEYDAAVTKAIEDIKAAIAKEFDGASNKGDLDAVEKWQGVLDRFEKEGVLSAETGPEKAVKAAQAAFVRALARLQKAHENVTAALTKEKNIVAAKAVRDEWEKITGDPSMRRPLPSARQGSIFQAVRQSVIQGQIDERSYVGGTGVGSDFRDVLSGGGVLIGVRVTTGSFGTGGYKAVASLEPIYRTEEGIKRGATHGPIRANAMEFVAKEGYAVGAIRLKMQPHPRVLGLQLVFMRINGNRLDSKDRYLSEPYIDVGQEAKIVGGDGRPIVGIKGSVSKEEMRGVGVIQLR